MSCEQMNMDIDNQCYTDTNSSSVLLLTTLPVEILLKIFDFCDRRSLRTMTEVSQYFANVIRVNYGDLGEDIRVDCLPAEILIKIFSFLPRSDLAKAGRVCRRFRDIAYADALWTASARDSLVTNARDEAMKQRSASMLAAREQVRVSRNWVRGLYGESRLIIQNVRYMPRLQLEGQTLWVSWGNRIWSHPRYPNGSICRTTNRVLKGHTDDVSRFVVKDGLLVSGGRDRTMVGWNSLTGEFLFAKRYCHTGEISAVDVCPGSATIVTGSRDQTMKIWTLDSNSGFPVLQSTVNIADRIWSLAADPSGSAVAVGTAGLDGIPSLHLLDLETGQPLLDIGQNLKRGAGMLDLMWQSDNTFLSCGYDSFTRLWDTRSGVCVRSWEEPFDEAIYCMSTDNNMSLVCGTARHGLVRLWDMRHKQPVQMFYTKHPHHGQSSPVYSVGFDQANLYVALDQCLNLLSFYGHNNQQRKYIR